MRIFVTGGSGVLGRVSIPLLVRAGHDVVAPRRDQLDLFDYQAVLESMRGAGAVVHLATSIPPPQEWEYPNSWDLNDRLRADASRILVSAALRQQADVYVQPTVTFVYPPGQVDEETPLRRVSKIFRSALVAEAEAERFSLAGRRGVVLRLGLLYGPGTGSDEPVLEAYGAVLHVEDAGAAIAAALTAPAGIYNVVEDRGRVSNQRFKEVTGWSPRHGF